MMGDSALLTTAVMPTSELVSALPRMLVAATMNTAPQGTPLDTASPKFIRGLPSTWIMHKRITPITAGVGVPRLEMAFAAAGATPEIRPGSSHMATTSKNTIRVSFSCRVIAVFSPRVLLSRLRRRFRSGLHTKRVSSIAAAKITRQEITPNTV